MEESESANHARHISSHRQGEFFTIGDWIFSYVPFIQYYTAWSLRAAHGSLPAGTEILPDPLAAVVEQHPETGHMRYPELMRV